MVSALAKLKRRLRNCIKAAESRGEVAACVREGGKAKKHSKGKKHKKRRGKGKKKK